jgi:hypothetical protein
MSPELTLIILLDPISFSQTKRQMREILTFHLDHFDWIRIARLGLLMFTNTLLEGSLFFSFICSSSSNIH